MGTDSTFENAACELFARLFTVTAASVEVKRLSGGASQETWALSSPPHEAILRRAPNGVSAARSSAAITLAIEAALIEAA